MSPLELDYYHYNYDNYNNYDHTRSRQIAVLINFC